MLVSVLRFDAGARTHIPTSLRQNNAVLKGDLHGAPGLLAVLSPWELSISTTNILLRGPQWAHPAAGARYTQEPPRPPHVMQPSGLLRWLRRLLYTAVGADAAGG